MAYKIERSMYTRTSQHSCFCLRALCNFRNDEGSAYANCKLIISIFLWDVTVCRAFVLHIPLSSTFSKGVYSVDGKYDNSVLRLNQSSPPFLLMTTCMQACMCGYDCVYVRICLPVCLCMVVCMCASPQNVELVCFDMCFAFPGL